MNGSRFEGPPQAERRRCALFALIFTGLGCVAGGDERTSEPAAATGAPGRYVHRMIVGPHTRRYVVYVPSTHDARSASPMVVALHGAGATADSFIDYTNWVACSEAHGFVLLAPEGLPLNPGAKEDGPLNIRVWNSGQFGAHYPTSRVDDETFVLAAMDAVMATWSIDRNRVYLTGHSSGGAMAFRLAGRRADRFTALATVAGIPWDQDPRPARAIPTLAIFGNLDPVVPKHGGLKILPWEMHPTPSVKSVMATWAASIGCPSSPTAIGELSDGSASMEDHGPGESGGFLRVMKLKHQGHAWPGGGGLRFERLLGPDLTAFDASESIWAFFSGWEG